MHNYFNLHKDVMDKKKSVMTHNYLFMENGTFARAVATHTTAGRFRHIAALKLKSKKKTMKLYNLMPLDCTSENIKLCKHR